MFLFQKCVTPILFFHSVAVKRGENFG